jgi:hypothetical protein
MKQDITFVDYLVNLLKPYKDEPFFTSCIMKAMEKLGHRVNTKSMYQKPVKNCQINDKTLQKDLFCDD